MRRIRPVSGPLALLFLPAPALAHGDLAVLLFPFGILVATAAILIVSAKRSAHLLVRMVAVILAIAASLLIGSLPSDRPPDSALGYLTGEFLPAFASGWLVLRLFRRKRGQ